MPCSYACEVKYIQLLYSEKSGLILNGKFIGEESPFVEIFVSFTSLGSVTVRLVTGPVRSPITKIEGP